MAHIFISYSSKNQPERDELYNFLLQNGFTSDEIWVDRAGIEAGDNWVEAIDEGLENAFVILVIATEEAMNSAYVIYEWSWAISRKIPVVPIFFSIKPTNFHRRLEKEIQYYHWSQSDNNDLINVIIKAKRESPLLLYTQNLIGNELIPIWILVALCDIFYEDYFHRYLSHYESLVKNTINIIDSVYEEKLPRFWLQYSHAFTAKQKVQFEGLLEQLATLQSLLNQLDNGLADVDFHRIIESQVQVWGTFEGYTYPPTHNYNYQANSYWSMKVLPTAKYFIQASKRYRSMESFFDAMTSSSKIKDFNFDRETVLLLSRIFEKDIFDMIAEIIGQNILSTIKELNL